MTDLHYRSECPVARILEVLGDKWTLLVVRDLMIFERRTFKQLCESNEGIPTNILSDRLKRLMEHGLADREQYQEHPPRYEYTLTDRGRSLRPILKNLADWGIEHLGGQPLPGSRKKDLA